MLVCAYNEEEVIEESVEEELVGDNVYSAFVEYLVPKGFQDAITVDMKIGSVYPDR